MHSPLAGRPLRATVLGLAALAGLSAALLPGGAARAEQPAGTAVVGELVQTWAEGTPAEQAAGSAAEAPLSWVRPASGGAVRVPTADVAHVPTGATVAVTLGGRVDDKATDDGYAAARDVLSAEVLEAPQEPVLPQRRITNQVTVALVAPRGSSPDGVTETDLVDAVDGPVAGFWAEQSDGAIALGVTAAHGWLTTEAGCADPTALWDEAAAAVGFTPGPGRHLVLYVTTDAPCSYALAEVGTAPASGGRLYVHDTVPSVIAHEFGHNFGLGHSSGRQCDGAVDAGRCRTAAYRDFYDVMGVSWASVGSLNAAQAARLGLLPAAAQQRVTPRTGTAQVDLAPLAGRAGTRAVRLTVAPGVDYWLEYRTATGRDAWLDSPANRYGLQPGVLLRRVGGLPDTSLLLDGSPTPAAGWDGDLQAALPVGTPVAVAGGAFTVTVRSESPESATVAVVPSPRLLAAAATPDPAAPAPADSTVLPGSPGAAPAPQPAGAPAGAGAPAPAPEGTAPEGTAPADTATRPAAPVATEAPDGTPTRVAEAAQATPPSAAVPAAAALALAGGLLLVVRRLRRRIPASRRSV